jgi:hypothetical protein
MDLGGEVHEGNNIKSLGEVDEGNKIKFIMRVDEGNKKVHYDG